VIDEPLNDDFDVLELGPGISPEDIVLSRPGNLTLGDLALTFTSSGETVTLSGQFGYVSTTSTVNPKPAIDEIRFAGGEVWTASDLEAHFLQSTSGADTIYGFSRRMDRLDGGAGDDFLAGLSHFDTYVFGRGYGVDRVDDYWDLTEPFPGDIIEFNADVAAADLIFERAENTESVSNGVDVVFQIKGTSDKLIIHNRAQSFVDVNFAGSSLSWSMDEVHRRYVEAHSTSGDDNFIRLDEAVVDTGAGNDRIVGPVRGAVLKGGSGDDTYVFKDGGHTRDIIVESGEAADFDTIEFTSEFSPSDLRVWEAANGRDLILLAPGGGRIIIKDGLAEPTAGVDRIVFYDGTVWDSATLAANVQPLPATGQILAGTAGTDTLTGTGTFDGLGGDDVLQGFGEEDIYLYRAGSGNDLVVEGYGEGADTVRLEGLSRGDVTIARAGANLTITINATGEVLTVQGQFGSTTTAGIEEIVFGDGAVLDAAAFLLSSSQAGTSADDVLSGGGSSDSLDGLAGDDLLSGLGGNDVLTGGLGDDILVGGEGDDRLDGGSGFDTVRVAGGAADYALSRNVDGTVRLEALTGDEGEDTLAGIEALYFIGEASTLEIGDLVADYGTSGNDGWVEGTSGADFLYGLAGDDTLAGRGGDDVYDGGDGDDTASFLGGLADYVLNRNADGSVTITALSGIDGTDVLHNIEGVYFEADQTYRSIESLVGQYGTAGDDAWVEGSANGDILYGLAGDDTLIGRAGDDRLDGGEGYDQANYLGDFDDFVFTRRPDGSITVTDTTGAEGVDTLVDIEAVYFDGSQTWAALGNVVAGYGTSGDDAWVEGTAFSDNIYGLEGDDTLVGREGDDFLYGGDGFDQANYFGSSTDFSFTLNPDGTVTVTDLVGDEGSDILSGVEALYFDGDDVWATVDAVTGGSTATSAGLWSPGVAYPLGLGAGVDPIFVPIDVEGSMMSAPPAALPHQEYMFA